MKGKTYSAEQIVTELREAEPAARGAGLHDVRVGNGHLLGRD
jgi:hypothetical protein